MFDTLRQAERIKTIVSILVRNGFNDFVSEIGIDRYLKTSFLSLSSASKLSRSERIRKTIEELGPTFIKMAQILSTRPDLIPLELVKEFSKLQDQVNPVPFEDIKPIFIEEFGKDVDEIFEGELILIASASLGQVYKGVLKNGDKVAIKILKPGVKETIKSDIAIMYKIASLLEGKLHSYGIDSPTKVVKEFEKSIKREINYTIEALNLKRFAKNFEGDVRIKVPKLYEEYSTPSILMMEYIEGIKVTDKKKLYEAGIDPKNIAKIGFDLVCKQIFVDRFFHADPHPGNIFAIDNNKIAFVDFGMMGSISQKDRKHFVDMIYYIIKQDEEKAALYILKLAKVENENLDINAFAKDMGDIIRTYFYGSLKEIDIKSLLDDIVSLMSQYRIYFKENNYLLVKAIVTIEGVGKELDPDFNATMEIKPFILQFYRENLSLKAFFSNISEMPKEFGDFLVAFPQDMKAIVDKMKSGNLKIEFEHIGLEKMEESMEKSANRLAVSIIVASILIGSALLLLAKTPPLFYGIPVLGLIGFLTAVVMGIILISSIYKKGRL